MVEVPFTVTRSTRVSELLERYGDLSELMEVFGVKPVGSQKIRRQLTQFLTVERAAGVQGIPLDRFLVLIQSAINQVEARRRKGGSSHG